MIIHFALFGNVHSSPKKRFHVSKTFRGINISPKATYFFSKIFKKESQMFAFTHVWVTCFESHYEITE